MTSIFSFAVWVIPAWQLVRSKLYWLYSGTIWLCGSITIHHQVSGIISCRAYKLIAGTCFHADEQFVLSLTSVEWPHTSALYLNAALHRRDSCSKPCKLGFDAQVLGHVFKFIISHACTTLDWCRKRDQSPWIYLWVQSQYSCRPPSQHQHWKIRRLGSQRDTILFAIGATGLGLRFHFPPW